MFPRCLWLQSLFVALRALAGLTHVTRLINEFVDSSCALWTLEHLSEHDTKKLGKESAVRLLDRLLAREWRGLDADFRMKRFDHAFRRASLYGYKQIMDWWLTKYLRVDKTNQEKIMMHAVRFGRIEVLEWLERKNALLMGMYMISCSDAKAAYWLDERGYMLSTMSKTQHHSGISATHNSSRRFYLIVDEIDHLFGNLALATEFVETLRIWKNAPFFFGFLGVGSHDLVHLSRVLASSMDSSPFDEDSMIRIEPFSIEQMRSFFKLIAEEYPISLPVQRAIMDYSSGAPGVFGSMIRLTVDRQKCIIDRYEWEQWFMVDKFSTYLDVYNNTYRNRQADLRSLSALEAEALQYVLNHDGRRNSNEVDEYFGGDQDDRLINSLLRMGILLEQRDGKLTVVSQMMRRICVEVLQSLESMQVASTKDSMKVSSAAFRHVNSSFS